MRIAVIGAGAWGTTLSLLLAEKKHEVSLWVFEKDLVREIRETRENRRFLKGFPLPETIAVTSETEAIGSADLYLFAVPTPFLRGIAAKFKRIVRRESIALSAGKGIEQSTLKLPLEILKEELPTTKLAALSGPNLSFEIARGLPAAAVAASDDAQVANTVQAALMLERFRVYVNDDPRGVQLGGALKNIIAIAAGVCDGLGLGNNAKAGLMIRGLVEITRLGTALGAKAETFAGLSGMGDLITTCSSKLSRNHSVGEQLASGKKLSEISAKMNEVAEGIPTTKAALALAEAKKVQMPITREVNQILFERKDPYQAITDLMTRAAASE